MANSELTTGETSGGGTRHSRSRERWQLLSKAVRMKKFREKPLCRESEDDDEEEAQLGMIDSYGLMSYEKCGQWVRCQWNPRFMVDYEKGEVELMLRLTSNRLSVHELAGFDNSGNIRLWPCEELMAYLFAYGMLKEKVYGKVVCELGAGMTALAGLVIASLRLHKELYLTDGNERCVANIEQIVERNYRQADQTCSVRPDGVGKWNKIKVRRLRWGHVEDYRRLEHRMDTIICSDCLFVRRAHKDLLDTIDFLLAYHRPEEMNNPNCEIGQSQIGGIAFIVAPRRGSSLQDFVDLVKQDGRFFLTAFESYGFCQKFDQLWQRLSSRNPTRYTRDSYYPYLLVMRRMLPRELLRL